MISAGGFKDLEGRLRSAEGGRQVGSALAFPHFLLIKLSTEKEN